MSKLKVSAGWEGHTGIETRAEQHSRTGGENVARIVLWERQMLVLWCVGSVGQENAHNTKETDLIGE